MERILYSEIQQRIIREKNWRNKQTNNGKTALTIFEVAGCAATGKTMDFEKQSNFCSSETCRALRWRSKLLYSILCCTHEFGAFFPWFSCSSFYFTSRCCFVSIKLISFRCSCASLCESIDCVATFYTFHLFGSIVVDGIVVENSIFHYISAHWAAEDAVKVECFSLAINK